MPNDFFLFSCKQNAWNIELYNIYDVRLNIFNSFMKKYLWKYIFNQMQSLPLNRPISHWDSFLGTLYHEWSSFIHYLWKQLLASFTLDIYCGCISLNLVHKMYGIFVLAQAWSPFLSSDWCEKRFCLVYFCVHFVFF